MTVENILITGITGQDGIFLTSHLATFKNRYNIINKNLDQIVSSNLEFLKIENNKKCQR